MTSKSKLTGSFTINEAPYFFCILKEIYEVRIGSYGKNLQGYRIYMG